MTVLYEKAPGWDRPPAGRCRPGSVLKRDYILDRWPVADNLGCYVDRGVTGSTATPSLHRDGRALDIGFNRDLDARDECFDWLVAHHRVLGVQMVLRYLSDGRGGDRWRLPYFVGDPNAGMGPFSKSGHWLHIEFTNAGADDPTRVADLIATEEDEMVPLRTPVRVYDSRDHRPLEPNETRTVPVGARAVFVRVTCIGLDGRGFASLTGGLVDTETSIANWPSADFPVGGGAPVLTDDGHIRVSASRHGRAHIIVDVFARG